MTHLTRCPQNVGKLRTTVMIADTAEIQRLHRSQS